MKNSMIINCNQINSFIGISNNNINNTSISNNYPTNTNNTSNSNNNNNNISNNKFQSQKNSQDQVPNSKVGKISKSGSLGNNAVNNYNSNYKATSNSIAEPNSKFRTFTMTNNFFENNYIINNNSNNNNTRNLGINNTINYINRNFNYNNTINNNFTSDNNYLTSEILNSSSFSDFSEKNKNLSSSSNLNNALYQKNYHNNNPHSHSFNVKEDRNHQSNEVNANCASSNTICHNKVFNSVASDGIIEETKHSESNTIYPNSNFYSKSNYNVNNIYFEKNEVNEESNLLLSGLVGNSCNIIDIKSTNFPSNAKNDKNNENKIAAVELIDCNCNNNINLSLENFIESMNLETEKGFKVLFRIYNTIKENNLDFRFLLELLKKFSIISPYYNHNIAFDYNSVYSNTNNNTWNGNGNNITYNYFPTINNIYNSGNSGYNANIPYEFPKSFSNAMIESYPLGVDLLRFFNDKETADLKIIVGDYIFYAHKVCLKSFYINLKILSS